MNAKIQKLEEELTKERSRKLAALKLSQAIESKYKSLVNNMNNKGSFGNSYLKSSINFCFKLNLQIKIYIYLTDTSDKTEEVKTRGAPTPICTSSGIMVRPDALEDAYDQLKPSMFYERLCYVAWDKKTLANRCVKKTRKTPEIYKELTPRKKRAVRKHFINYLSYYNYHETLFNKELSNMHTYAHRAITSSRKYVKLLEEYPILDIDIEEPDVQKVEL